ncbi:MAG: replicative DNA helicase [Clostridiales bacterium]|nr:replicative DNA helicase [Clostridiales bacterium]
MADERGKSLLMRVPPQNKEAEIAVLCCCMEAPEKLELVTGYLLADDFYEGAHQKIYQTIYTLYSQSKTVDLITVGDALRKQGDLEKIGGMEYLSSITDAHALVSNLTDYVRIVKQKAMSRRLIRTMEEVTRQTYEGESDPANLLEVAISRLAELRGQSSSETSLVKIQDIFDLSKERFFNNKQEKAVMSHFAMLDYVTNGFRPGTLSIVAARPSMGKSAFVINIAVNVALLEKVPVAFFSLEMNALEIANRILASRGDLPISVLQSNKKPDSDMLSRISAAMGMFKNTELYINEQSGLNSAEILTQCRELQNQLGRPLGLICIDYLQLMSPVTTRSNASRQQEVSEISRALKLMAKELKVPIIALAQLSRESEKRDDHRPMLSDLRDSGAIEQDADMVMFIHRPDYYKRKEEVDEDEDGETNEKSKFKKKIDEEEIQKAEIIVAKNRQGPTKTIFLSWNGSRTVFFEKDKPNPNAPRTPTDDDAPPESAMRSVEVPEELFENPVAAVPQAPVGAGVSEPVSYEPDAFLESMGLEPIGAELVQGSGSSDSGTSVPREMLSPTAGTAVPPEEGIGSDDFGIPAPSDEYEIPAPSDSDMPYVPDMQGGVTEEESEMGFAPMESMPWNTSTEENDDDDYEPDEPDEGSWYDEPGDSGDEDV